MMVPLDVRFNTMSCDEQVVWEIDAHVADLDRLYDSIIGCHVTVFGPDVQDGTSGLYEVKIALMLPCCEIHVDRRQTADACMFEAVGKAFASVKEQLEHWLAKRHPMRA